MKPSTFLKEQLTDFVENYQKHFLRSLGIALTLTIFCFVAIAVLLKFTKFDQALDLEQQSVLSFFFNRYSYGSSYCIVDLAKTVFLFFVSLFSLGIERIPQFDNNEQELSNSSLFKVLTVKDMISLLGVLVFCAIFDFGTYKLDTWVYTEIAMDTQEYYLNSLIYLVRIFFPLLMFSIVTYRLSQGKNIKLSGKKILYLFIALWLFNEFAYLLTMFVRSYIFPLFLLPFRPQLIFFIESALGLPLIAIFFLGYHSAMVNSLKQFEDPANLILPQSQNIDTEV